MSKQPDVGSTPRTLTPGFEAQVDRERRNPFFRWLVHIGAPISLSVALHLLLIGFFAWRTFQILSTPAEEVGDYSASLTDSLADQMNNAFQWTDPHQLQALPEQKDPSLENLLDFTDLQRDLDTSSLTQKDPTNSLDEGLGIGEGRLSVLGTGSGAAESGEGGFGAGMGGGDRRLGMAGVWEFSVRANKIDYVIDYSGSIVVAVDDLKRELKRSIGRLEPYQAFDVILFYSNAQSDKPTADAFAGSLQNASEEVKKKFFDWIDRKAPIGGTDPLPAMKRALSMRPEAIFFFSDGMFEDSAIAEIKAANKGKTKIYCLVFDELLLGDTSGMPRETDGAKRMKRIADESGGKVKIVTGADLKRR